MDSIQHAAHGYIVMKACELITGQDLPWTTEAAGAVVGASHDIIGFAEKVVKRNWNLWQWYDTAHSPGAAFLAVFVIFFGLSVGPAWSVAFGIIYLIHIVLDMLTHEDRGAKRNWYPPSEMWRENFFKALAYCWPNWLGWGASAMVFVAFRHWS